MSLGRHGRPAPDVSYHAILSTPTRDTQGMPRRPALLYSVPLVTEESRLLGDTGDAPHPLTGQMRETRTPVVAISLSGSRRSFSLTGERGGGISGEGAAWQCTSTPSPRGQELPKRKLRVQRPN